MSKDLEYADHISDRVIDLLNAEIKSRGVDFSPVGALAGLMLGMLGYLKTAPYMAQGKPASLVIAEVAVQRCLDEMIEGLK